MGGIPFYSHRQHCVTTHKLAGEFTEGSKPSPKFRGSVQLTETYVNTLVHIGLIRWTSLCFLYFYACVLSHVLPGFSWSACSRPDGATTSFPQSVCRASMPCPDKTSTLSATTNSQPAPQQKHHSTYHRSFTLTSYPEFPVDVSSCLLVFVCACTLHSSAERLW